MLWIAYGMQMDNSVCELNFFMVNVIFYCMEMRFVVCKELIMVMGGFGPVELELLLSTLLASFGYFGPEFY